MTYSQKLALLQNDYQGLSAELQQIKIVGFDNGMDIVDYLIKEQAFETARIKYFQYFTRCVRAEVAKIDIDIEIDLDLEI